MGKDKKPFHPDKDWWDFIENDPDIEEGIRSRFRLHAQKITGVDIYLEARTSSKSVYSDLNNIHLSKCFSCNNLALWLGDRLLYPDRILHVEPNADMPPDVKADFIEAQAVSSASPRSAAALLRLAIQKLLAHLNVKARNINDGIKKLVADGLDVRIQRALDIVRVVGNNAVHPGQMDIGDDRETVDRLFHLVNLICDYGISQPKMIDELYARLPGSAKKQVEQRDKRS
jgi:hypothetical protein